MWSEWVADGCTVTCGGGVGKFTRSCTNPRPGTHGTPCDSSSMGGEKTDAVTCGAGACPGIKYYVFRINKD